MKKGENTRHTILRKAFELSYQQGYQATSVDDIINLTTVSKGSFFYHFKSKEQMGLAMIREIMYPGMKQSLVSPLYTIEDPLVSIYEMIKTILTEDPLFDSRLGCPAVNMIEEMAPLHPAFKKEIRKLTDEITATIESLLTNGEKCGKITRMGSARQAATFIITGYMGVRALGKLYGVKCYSIYLNGLKAYLEGLR